jgi:radical SAM superfamily enzyme YgiQ (UPF0313 family)
LRILNKECTEDDNNFAIEFLNSISDSYVAKGLIPPRFWANIMLAVPGETMSDAIRTVRMMKRMRYAIPSISLFSPYPGSVLGYQIIAENKSLMSKENYHRYPNQATSLKSKVFMLMEKDKIAEKLNSPNNKYSVEYHTKRELRVEISRLGSE